MTLTPTFARQKGEKHRKCLLPRLLPIKGEPVHFMSGIYRCWLSRQRCATSLKACCLRADCPSGEFAQVVGYTIHDIETTRILLWMVVIVGIIIAETKPVVALSGWWIHIEMVDSFCAKLYGQCVNNFIE